MEEPLFYVYFNWSGKDIERITDLNENYKEAVNRHFVELRNKACDALNAKYDEWNKEFDEKYPNSDSDSNYMKYFSKKRNEVLSSIHDEIFKLRADDNAVIIGDLIGTDSSVFTTVSPANDEAKKIW